MPRRIRGLEFSYTVGSGMHSRTGRMVTDNPYLFQTFAAPFAEQILRDLRETLGEDISDYVKDRIRAGIYTWSQNLYRNAQSRQELEDMHQRIADGVHKAITTAFDQSKIGKKHPSYRYNDNFKYRRFSNKKLKRAIHSPELVGYDYKGVFFPNTELLDREAPQWYRLNFGAGPAGEASPTPRELKPMMFGQRPTETRISFSNFRPSAGFFVPQTGSGFWSSVFSNRTNFKSKAQFQRITGNKATGGNGALYLHGLPNLGFASRMSRGIVATRFLDKGANYLNRQYGRELSWLLETWYQEALIAGKLQAGRRNSISPWIRAQMNGTQVTQGEIDAARTRAGHVNTRGGMTESTINSMPASEFDQKNPNWFEHHDEYPPYVVEG